MASINSIMGGSSSNSVYGNKNIISGLASGMDTESMIENAISGHKLKLELLQQQRTRVEWQQSAYRSVIDKMVAFNQKYMSYSGGNNLLSEGFFNSAINVESQGTNADKIAAVGKTSSEVIINSVEQLATNARYTVGVGNLTPSSTGDIAFNLKGDVHTGAIKGSLTIGYGGKNISLDFGEKDVFQSAQEMVDSINKKLEDQTITFQGGSQYKASEKIKAVVDGEEIRFEKVSSSDTNDVWIESASGNVEDKLHINTSGDEHDLKGFKFNVGDAVDTTSVVDLMHDKGFTIVVDGISKTVKGPSKDEMKEAYGDDWTSEQYLKVFNKKLEDAFGANKIVAENAVSTAGEGNGTQLKLKFSTNSNAKFSVSSAAGKQIGMEEPLTSFVSMRNKLGDLVSNLDSMRMEADVTGKTLTEKEGVYTDETGNHYIKETDAQGVDTYYKADKDGNALIDFKMNGKSVATFTSETTLKEMMDTINDSETANVKMSYSEFSNKFTFTSKLGGAGHKIEFDEGLGKAMFGHTNQAEATSADGSNAKFTVTVNGEKMELNRDSNTLEIDGMKITLKDTFEASPNDSDAVTFQAKTDSDRIINVVKDMVKDYNEMAKLIKDTYSTMPMQNSKGKPYMPLTDKDREDMSESEEKAYEEKAKKGILFADRDLSNLYDGMRNALNVLSATGHDYTDLGLTTSFENGATTLSLDETKLRKALDQDPDKVKEVFTQSKENGAASNGLMAGLKTQMDRFASVSGAQKGILIEKAGSPMAPTSIFQNELQKKLGNFDRQIQTWQTKLSDQIDYYNHKFTVLEQLIAEMNNQGGMLMGLGGGY